MQWHDQQNESPQSAATIPAHGTRNRASVAAKRQMEKAAGTLIGGTDMAGESSSNVTGH
jgi:hypothetical protein